MRKLFTIALLLCFVASQAQLNYGNNVGYYGNQYTDQQLYDLMKKSGGVTTRSFLAIEPYLQFGMSTFQARLTYPYNTLGFRNNVINLSAGPGVGWGDYVGRDTSHVSGNQTWLPKGLYLAAFNSDSSINTNNVWAKYCADLVQSVGSAFDYYEVWNEPDITGSPDSYLDSNQSATSWQKRPPAPNELFNLYPPNGVHDYVQLCKITYQVMHHYKPSAKVCSGGVGYSWFYQWFLTYGGGQWLDEVSIHLYPYYNWATYPNFDNRNSDYAVTLIDSSNTAQKRAETVTGSPHLPIMITEVNVPGWSYAGNCDSFPCNRVWGNSQVQRNFGIKGISKMLLHGFTNFYLFALGCQADSANTSGNEFNSMGWYKNLTTTTPGNEVATDQGIACTVLRQKVGNYTPDATQPTWATGLDGVRFDSSGVKVYMVWAKTHGKGDASASGSYTVPSGTFTKYAWNGVNNGTATGTIALTGDPIYLVQSGAPPTVVCNAGSNQTITLPTNSVSLNGSASTGATSYAWTQVGTTPNVATITNATSAIATASNLIAGLYTFQLSLNSGASTCTTTIQVNTAPQSCPNCVVANPSGRYYVRGLKKLFR